MRFGNGCAVALLAALEIIPVACGKPDQDAMRAKAEALRQKTRPVRIGMDELHRMGGVPPSWRFTPPAGDAEAGRRAFVDFRCNSCHRVAGEPFPAPAEGGAVGPDLTGMGSHHPAEYFAEAILNPDAVLVEGPGYIGPDGRSVMPTYPYMTLAQLADLVTYLKGLTQGGGAHAMSAPIDAPKEVPPPPAQPASIFFVQAYDINDGSLDDFESWFKAEGAAAFLAHDGVVNIETWVDTAHDSRSVVTVIGFRDEAALRRFLADPGSDALGQKFDEFIGPHGHKVFRVPPVYKAETLSAP